MAVDINSLKLPAVSKECAQVIEMLGQDDISLQKLCKVISVDPILSSTLLKYANSPLHRRSNQVTNVNIAVNLLGMKNVRAAAMMATMRAFSGDDNSVNLLIWEHSITISALCRLIAEQVSRQIVEEMELIGTLHDMPALVMSTNYPTEYKELIESAKENNTPHEVLWNELFGISQDDVMVRFSKEFRLPEMIDAVLRAYHSREPITTINGEEDKYLAILALAHHIDRQITEGHMEEMDDLMQVLGLNQDDVDNLIEDSDWATTEKMQI